MRVPIYPKDLMPQAAFRKLAKSIQNRWPGESPIQLSLAYETLSKGLGYADYHELRNASVIFPLEAGTPAESAVRAGIAAAISSVLALANDSSVPRSALEPLVETLPLKALTIFKVAASQGLQVGTFKHPRLDFNLADTCSVNSISPESQIPSYMSPTTRERRSGLHTSPLNSGVHPDIDAIKKAVMSSGSLRDQSLFALLEMGLRGHVILGTKVSQIFSMDTHMPSSVEITKSKLPLHFGDTAVITRYISSENLYADDYLFPSNDRKRPMSSKQLLQTFRSWERQAQLPPSNRTPHSMRPTFIARRGLFVSTATHEVEPFTHQLGHSFAYVTEHYLKPDPKAVHEMLKASESRS